YLIVGTIGATFFLVGVGFVYSMTGTLNMQDLAERLPELSSTRTVIAALAFIVVGICLKLALFPLHLWLPNAYAYAPSIAAAFLAASATKVALYLLIRFSYTVFSIEFVFGSLPVSAIFVSLGFMGVFIASLVAIYQSDIKRMFAYSSVAQIGYMIVGFGLGSATGLQAALLHMFNHALMKGALFLALAAVVYRVANPDISSMRGLGRRMPWTMAAIVVGGLSLIGMPLTAGFVSKWYLVLAALEANAWPVAMLVVLGSLLTIAYVWRIVETAYFASDSAPDNAPDSVSGFAPGSVSAARLNKMEAPLSLLIPTWILVLANIYFGIDTRLSVTLSEQAAVYLMGVTP
ncbi:MAG: proton-conducting transporter membrane subunit, partial [Pseudohongiellaceae bacterium]